MRCSYPADTLQIYFSASLEIQEELIKHGFKVPSDETKKIKTPIPLIYANSRGWLKDEEPITIERLIPPVWFNKTPEDFGWIETTRRNKRAYYIPPEEVSIDVIFDESDVHFIIKAEKYHLERTSIRQIGPEKWTNWAMFYISADFLDDLIDALKAYDSLADFGFRVYVERQQGGKEFTLFASTSDKLGIPIKHYSFCLGCFDLAIEYLRCKAVENGLHPSVVDRLTQTRNV